MTWKLEMNILQQLHCRVNSHALNREINVSHFVKLPVAGTEEQVALAFLVVVHPLSDSPGTLESCKMESGN